MIPLMAAGAGANLGGQLMAGYGQSIGAQAAGRARLRQLAEQQELQRQADLLTGNAIHATNPAEEMAAASDIDNASAQAEIARHSAVHPASADLQGGAAQAAMAAQQGAVSNDASARTAVRSRLRSLNAPQQNAQNRLVELGSQTGNLEDQARRKASLYDYELANAANEGIAFRQGGGLLASLGKGAMGASGF